MRTYLLLFIGVYFTNILSNHTEAAEPLIIASVEYAPYTSSQMNNDGYVNQIVRQAFASKGIQTSFEYLPWARALKQGQEGHYEVISYAQFLKERTQHFLYSKAIVSEEFYFFARRDSSLTDYSGISSLVDVRLGLTRGYAYTEALWQYAQLNQDKVSVVNSDVQNFQMLALKRIDVFPINRLVGRRIIKEHFDNNQHYFRELKPSVITQPTYLLFSKQSPRAIELQTIFNTALAEMEASGELGRLEDALSRSFHE